MRFLFVCGGSAGHINPALAVAGRLRELCPDAAFMFAGAGRVLERRLIPAAGFELTNITVTGLRRGVSPADIRHNLMTLRNLSVAKKESRELLENFRPDVVFGTGGYVCWPVLREAARMGIPTATHESNAVPGLTTKMLSGYVDKAMVAFPSVGEHYKRPERVVLTGTPVREDFLQMTREEAKRKLGLTGKPLAVSFWGSLGADNMNSMMADFIRLNAASGAMLHLHATGNGETGLDKMRERLDRIHVSGLPQWETVQAYIDNMGPVMTAADLILCRAGASTLAEITALGRACVLVPSPNVTNDQQTKNARELEKAGGAVVLTESECTGKKLYDAACSLIEDKKRLEAMEKASRALGVPDACDRIAGEILNLIHK